MTGVHTCALPILDNPQLAAKHFINAIDRVGNMLEQQTKKITELDSEIAMLQGIARKPFSKEQELKEAKQASERLGREIAMKIQAREVIENMELPAEGESTEIKVPTIKQLEPQNEATSNIVPLKQEEIPESKRGMRI